MSPEGVQSDRVVQQEKKVPEGARQWAWERGAGPRHTVEAELPALGERLALCTGQEQGWQGSEKGKLQPSGQLEGGGDFH